MRALAAATLLALAPANLAAAPEFTTQRYTCDRGVEVPVTYVNAAEGSLVVLTVEGRQITLVNEPAASGARYGWPSGGSNYVWWTKGDGATLFWKTPEGEAALLTCTAAS
jgi:membrane-bound inhibitor of C-type lysozyme